MPVHKRGAEGDGIVVERGKLERAVAAPAGAVGFVVAHAHRDARDALAGVVGAFAGAELGLGLEVVDLFNAVLDEERLGEALQLELAHAAVELREHGFEDGIFFGVGAGGLSCGRVAKRRRRMRRQKIRVSGESNDARTKRIHCASFVAGAWESAPGMGRIGGRAVPCGWRCVSMLAEQHGRSDGADGDGARLRAALAVEDFALVAGGEDALHGGERRADDADAADQLVGTAIDIDAPDDERNDLEGLRRAALRDGEAGGDVFKVEAVGLALLFGFVDQLLAQFGVGDGLGRGDDQVALAAGGHVACLRRGRGRWKR